MEHIEFKSSRAAARQFIKENEGFTIRDNGAEAPKGERWAVVKEIQDEQPQAEPRAVLSLKKPQGKLSQGKLKSFDDLRKVKKQITHTPNNIKKEFANNAVRENKSVSVTVRHSKLA